MTLQEQKNLRIKASYLATKERRKNQVPLTFEFGIRNEKRNRKNGVFEHLNGCFLNAKWIWNSIVSQTDDKIMGEGKSRKASSFSQKDFKTVVHKDFEGNDIEDEVLFLSVAQKDAVIDQFKHALAGLNAKKKLGMKVGRIKFKSEFTSLTLKQYGITHKICGPNSYQIQGIKTEVRVAGMRQLRNLDKAGIAYEMATAKIVCIGGDYYIHQTVYVDKDVWNAYKESKHPKERIKYSINALDLGCMKTVTDAYGETYNTQVEEPERLKKLQRKKNRQMKAAGWNPKAKKKQRIKCSNNQWKIRQAIKRQYHKMDCKRNEESIRLCNKILEETETLVIQDENLDGWKRTGHGKKVQHGILGRVKERLQTSEKTHVINQWVPTTKLCTHCGEMMEDLTQRDRHVVCPHCGCDDGERDCHSARIMIWLYSNMKDSIGLDGAEFTREVFDDSLNKLFHKEIIEGNPEGRKS